MPFGGPRPGRCRSGYRSARRKDDRMTVLADVLDAVVGADTHRDSHTLEITTPTGATVATLTVPNTDAGSAQALAWIAERAPGPRVMAAVEGSRSYGVGLARAFAAAGMTVLEI